MTLTSGRPLLLASRSRRRHVLLQTLGIEFDTRDPQTDEYIPDSEPIDRAAVMIARNKALSVLDKAGSSIVLAADTIVVLDDRALLKPAGKQQAIEMLSLLSGRDHHVVTGVALIDAKKDISFAEITKVRFRKLSPKVIEQYVDQMRPYDKAGGYGIQEIVSPGTNLCSNEEREFLKAIKIDLYGAMTADSQGEDFVDSIEGSFFNVVGLPVQRLFKVLATF